MYIKKSPGIEIKSHISYTKKYLISNKIILDTVPPNDIRKDTVSISQSAKTLFAEIGKLKELVEKNSTIDNKQPLLEMVEHLRKQSEQKNDSSDDLLKCIAIAMRIIDGHHVPIKDERFLAEKEPQMYLNAVMLRRRNENSKDYDSILKDEEDENDDSIPAISDKSICTEDMEASVETESN